VLTLLIGVAVLAVSMAAVFGHHHRHHWMRAL
jgi:hypothetical protein